MIHPDTELRYVNDVIGYGVFATRHIPRGTITWVRDELDQAFSPDQILGMSDLSRQVLDKYGYTDRHGKTDPLLGPCPLHEPLVRGDLPERGLRLRSRGPGPAARAMS